VKEFIKLTAFTSLCVGKVWTVVAAAIAVLITS